MAKFFLSEVTGENTVPYAVTGSGKQWEDANIKFQDYFNNEDNIWMNTEKASRIASRRPSAWYRAYVNSPGFQDKLNKSGASSDYQQYLINRGRRPFELNFDDNRNLSDSSAKNYYTDNGNINWLQPSILNVGTKVDNPLLGTDKQVAAHELGHLMFDKNSFNKQGLGKYSFYNSPSRLSFRNIGSKDKWEQYSTSSDTNVHDNSPQERAADIMQLRYDMYNSGIWNTMDKNDVLDQDKLNKFKDLHKDDFYRPLHHFDDDALLDILNNTASINKTKRNTYIS